MYLGATMVIANVNGMTYTSAIISIASLLISLISFHCSYDTISKKWQYLKSMRILRSIYTVATVQNCIFISGEGNRNKWPILRYSPRTDSWMDVASVKFQSMLYEWKGHLYAIDIGKGDPGLDDVWRYQFKQNKWVKRSIPRKTHNRQIKNLEI